MKTLIVIAIVLTAIGLVGHIEYQDQLMEQASITCANQNTTTMPTKEQCINNQLELNGDK